jgi:hypothetical protein
MPEFIRPTDNREVGAADDPNLTAIFIALSPSSTDFSIEMLHWRVENGASGDLEGDSGLSDPGWSSGAARFELGFRLSCW